MDVRLGKICQLFYNNCNIFFQQLISSRLRNQTNHVQFFCFLIFSLIIANLARFLQEITAR